MKRALIGLLTALPLAATAATEPVAGLRHVEIDVTDRAALQRGAGLFVNNCMGCHSARYMRWNRVAEDIGITTGQLVEYLQTTGSQPGDLMTIAMDADRAEHWFGLPPPDLTLVARSRGTMSVSGTDWIYSFLHGFYLDEDKPTGVNNVVFPDTAMPHVLWDLQGTQRAVFEDGRFVRFEQVTPGRLDAAGYDRAVRDLTTFLSYLAEPVQERRRGLGSMVVLFLLFFLVFAYLLKREYWKDVH